MAAMASRLWASKAASCLKISTFNSRGFASVPKDLKYSDFHLWVKAEGKSATIGITDCGQDIIGEMIGADLPEVGVAVTRGNNFAAVDSAKVTVDFSSPVSGKVTEFNQEVSATSELVNESPYEEGWFIKVEMSDTNEVNSLMDSKQYIKFCEEEYKRFHVLG